MGSGMYVYGVRGLKTIKEGKKAIISKMKILKLYFSSWSKIAIGWSKLVDHVRFATIKQQMKVFKQVFWHTLAGQSANG